MGRKCPPISVPALLSSVPTPTEQMVPKPLRSCPPGQLHLFATGRELPECSLPEKLLGVGGWGDQKAGPLLRL